MLLRLCLAYTKPTGLDSINIFIYLSLARSTFFPASLGYRPRYNGTDCKELDNNTNTSGLRDYPLNTCILYIVYTSGYTFGRCRCRRCVRVNAWTNQ